MSVSTLHSDDEDVTLIAPIWPPNPPSQLEREIIKKRISLSDKRSNQYHLKIANAKVWISQLEEMLTRETRERLILQGSLSALRRMPDDVLSLIFQSFSLELQGSPWVLAQVSTTFRRVAFACPSLWSRIQLSHLAEPEPTCRYQHGREICNNLPRLQAALARSSTALLDIEVLGFESEMALEIVQERARWGSFHMGNQSYDHSLVRWMIVQAQPIAPLENVSLNGIVRLDYIHQFLGLAQPVSLYLPNPCDLRGLAWRTWSNRLRKLDVSNLKDGFELIEILKMTGFQLTSLSLSHIQFDLESMPTFILFLNLLELSLIEVTAWWRFAAPNVHTVTLIAQGNLPESMGLAYPSLKQFVFNPQKSQVHPASIFAPALESLTLQHVTSQIGHAFFTLLPGCFQRPTEMHLRHLHIDDCCIPFRELVDSMRLLKLLQSIRISNTPLPISFYKAFKMPTGGGLICPLLEQMVVDLTRCKVANRDAFSDTFKEITSARQQILTKFCVIWPEKWNFSPTQFV